ncbi:MAG: TonB-dependent receptor plug domain-containing protein, partial [Cyanobacteriota bacterium]
MKKNLFFAMFFSCILQQVAFAEKDKNINSLSLEELLNINVVSASKQEEPLKETPVPVTVITEDMIKHLGARSIKDLLLTYVPGITYTQDTNEMYVSMRGIYGSSQQKILVLLNGHRLNSRAYSEANTDFSMSLDKIKQIEILRGPASSLYGNVALTAVINIITLSGEDLNGSKISIAGGNYGQKKVSITHGKKFSDNNELVLWGNYYEADGQPFAISKEQDFSQKPQSGVAILDGIKDRPAYDLGLNYKYEDFSLLANIRANHYISPFSEKGQVYKPDDFRKLLGLSTGLSTPSSHLGLFYNKEIINDLELSFELYNDYNSVIGTVASDSTNKSGFGLSWNEFSMGGISQLNKKYDLSALGKGSFIFGLQADTMNLYDSMWPNIPADGDYKDFKDSNKSKILETGTETIY